ncbi:hypothetical protein SKAU_G00132870 [Synaphobranchus kaupii]|uniref:Uncharacterized protein n=1 Tax=Synaphobranchus kaupii TaxID=118154 RepID=A0A9Q1FRA4_SYNKA|nr:hypothetical protein SKAU_G00132870 [Synaphobranchus kaupii]
MEVNHRLPPVFLDNIPPELRRPVARRKRGRRGGIRNRLRRRYTRPPLPSIILSKLRSLNNKVDEIRAYASGKAAQTAATIADCVHKLQQRYPDAPAIVLGDLNHLDSTLPGFCQKTAFKNKDLAKRRQLDKDLKKKLSEGKQAHRQRL